MNCCILCVQQNMNVVRVNVFRSDRTKNKFKLMLDIFIAAYCIFPKKQSASVYSFIFVFVFLKNSLDWFYKLPILFNMCLGTTVTIYLYIRLKYFLAFLKLFQKRTQINDNDILLCWILYVFKLDKRVWPRWLFV